MKKDNLLISIGDLPFPLNELEFNQLFIQFKNGDMKAREKIIIHNIRLVIYEIFKRFEDMVDYYDEILSVGVIGLIKSVDTFDLSKDYKFSTYAVVCIDNEILMYLRKLETYNKYFCSLSSGLVGEVGVKSYVDVMLHYERKETISIIRHIVEELPSRDKEILKLYFGFYDRVYSQREIATIVGIDQAYVSRIIKRRLELIEVKLKRMDIIDKSFKRVKEKK